MSRRNIRNRRPVGNETSKKVIIGLIIVLLFSSGIYVARSAAQRIADQQKIQRIKKEKAAKAAKEKARIEKEKKLTIYNAKKESADKFGIKGDDIWNRINSSDYSNDGKKYVFLTFDDGPSTTVTPQVLDVLKKEDVKATFFVVGRALNSDNSKEILKRTFEEGHSIGNHTFSHNYPYLYPGRSLNLDNFLGEINKNEKEIQSVLGPRFKITNVRCPGGYMSWQNMDPLASHLKEKKMASIDWNALNGDAQRGPKTPEALYNNAVSSSQGNDIVILLMHDTYGKETTAASLENIIKYYKNAGYEFKILI